MSRRYRDRTWPTHRSRSKRNRHGRRPPAQTYPAMSYEQLAQALVDKGRATPQIMGGQPYRPSTERQHP